MRKPKMHFEQIPVKEVKKIAEEEVSRKTTEHDNVIVETPAKKTEPYSIRAHSGTFGVKDGTWNMGASFEEKGDDLKYPEWQEPLREALLELDKDRLKARVAAAETAIIKRLQIISRTADNQEERQAIEDGLANLRVLKREILGPLHSRPPLSASECYRDIS